MSDPLQKGLSAGQAAYSGISATDLSALKKSVGSGLSAAAAQRQVLDTNAAKQKAGQYPVSGTSAAAYNYLRGQGGYPVNAVPSDQPVNTGIPKGYGGLPSTSGTQLLPARVTPTTPTVIQKPYETATNVGTNTQTKLATDATTGQTKMGKVTSPTVNMPKPSMLQQLTATAAPLALGYYALDKTGGLGYLTNAYNNFMYPTGVYSAEGTLLAPNPASYFAPPAAAPAAADTFETALVDSFQNVPANTYAGVNYADASGVLGDGVVTDAGGAATAGGISDAAAGWDAATAGEYGGPAAAGTLSDLEVAQAATNAEAAGMDWAAMTAEYGPYLAAAIIADQTLNGGRITEGITNAVGDVVQGAGDIVEGAGDVISSGADALGSGVKTVASWFGWADGGQVKGYADGGISAAQGLPNRDISVGAPNQFRQTVGVQDGLSSAHAPYDNQSMMYENTPTVAMARGGISAAASHLGDYSDGGRLLRGPGDGVSDSIPATIGGKQPARLADGEFVVPARIVSEIGNGSTEAGARKLYAMMDRVQAARGKTVGKGKVAKNTRADKYLPK